MPWYYHKISTFLVLLFVLVDSLSLKHISHTNLFQVRGRMRVVGYHAHKEQNIARERCGLYRKTTETKFRYDVQVTDE